MSILTRFASSFVGTKAAGAAPYGGGTAGFSAPFVDAYNKNRAPSPLELIRENLGTAYACATLNADLIASTPLRLYVKTRKGDAKSRLSKRGDAKPLSTKRIDHLQRVASKQVSDAEEVEEVTSHPVLALLDKPNMLNEDGVGMSGFNLFNLTQQFQEVVGRCYWWIDKSGIGNTPASLWILAPQRVSEMPSYGKDSRIIDYYQFNAAGNQATQRYEVDEVAPFRMPDLYNVYTGGTSPLRAVFEQVRLSRKLDAHTNATLDNGGKPSAIWSPVANGDIGGIIGDTEAERMRRAFRQAFAQAGAGGVMVAQEAGSLEILNWPIKDIVDASRYPLTLEMICNAFGVPTTKIRRNDANRASATTGDYAHAKDAGLPRCRRNEAALNTFILPAYGPETAERLFFVYDDPPGLNDPDGERAEFDSAEKSGATTRNDRRARLGLPAVPWGDQPLVPATMIAVDAATGIPASRPQPDMSTLTDLAKRVQKLETHDHANASTRTGAGAAARAGSGGDAGGTAVVHDESSGHHTGRHANAGVQPANAVVLASTETDDASARPLPTGEGLIAILHRAFGEQRRAILSQIQESKSTKAPGDPGTQSNPGIEPLAVAIPDKFVDLSAWNETIAREAMPVAEIIMRQEGQKLLLRVGASPDVFSVFEKNIPKAAEELSLKFAESTNTTTSMKLDDALGKLRQEISDGLTEGDTRIELTNRVQEIFDEADTSRAEMIARTEASRAAHQGELMGAKESKVVSRKFWLLSSDACPICDEIAADNPDGVPLDKTFAEFGGDYGSIDGPPAHPNCQCSVTYSVNDDGSKRVKIHAPGNEGHRRN